MQNKINELRKKLIVETAGKYFNEFGYEKTQIDKIAKELTIGVGTIYSIFGSKEGLFLAWVYSIMENAHIEITQKFDTEKSAVEKLKIFIDYKLSYYQKRKAVVIDYMQNNQFFLKNTARGANNPMYKMYDLLSAIIEEIVTQNRRKLDDYLISAYVLDGIINAYIERYSRENVDLSTKTNEVLEVFLNSIKLGVARV